MLANSAPSAAPGISSAAASATRFPAAVAASAIPSAIGALSATIRHCGGTRQRMRPASRLPATVAAAIAAITRPAALTWPWARAAAGTAISIAPSAAAVPASAP